MRSPHAPDGETDPGAHYLSMLARGRREADADRPDLAERLFRDVLRDARGTPAERLACSYLAKLYMRQGRALEALIAARRLAVFATLGGTAEDRAFAWTGVVAALLELGDHCRFDSAAQSLATALDAYEGRHAAALRRHLHRTRTLVAVARGDLETARAELDLAAPPVSAQVPADEACEFHVVTAQVRFASGRFEEARAALMSALAVPSPLGMNAVAISFLETRCALAIEGAAAAVAPAHRLLDLLTSPGAASFGTASRLGNAHRVAVLLHRECGALDDARRAFDVAATASAASFAELARCSGEGSLLTAGEGSVVAAFRDRLAAARTALAADAEALLSELRVRTLTPATMTVALCVKCDRARLAGGTLIPFPALARSTAMPSVSFGVCEECPGGSRR